MRDTIAGNVKIQFSRAARDLSTTYREEYKPIQDSEDGWDEGFCAVDTGSSREVDLDKTYERINESLIAMERQIQCTETIVRWDCSEDL
jgi:hypothetical protein